MKNFVFALAFLLMGSFGFANNAKELYSKNSDDRQVEIKKENNVIEEKLEIKILDTEVVCTRSCFYQGGELIGCTEWKCTRIATEELDEVVIQA